MDVAKSTVSLSWARPRDDGGSRVTGYYVERREVSTEKWVRHNKTHITTTMYNVSGLIPDAEYMFRVVAQNDIGQSEPGPASESVVCKDPFGELTLHNAYFCMNILIKLSRIRRQGNLRQDRTDLNLKGIFALSPC